MQKRFKLCMGPLRALPRTASFFTGIRTHHVDCVTFYIVHEVMRSEIGERRHSSSCLEVIFDNII